MPSTPKYGLRYPAGSDEPNGPLQLANLATDVEDTLDDGLLAWQSWNPVWTASVTNPVLGDGSRYGRYVKLGRTVHFSGKITIGSTTDPGDGFYSISLPSGLAVSALGTTLCHGYYFDADAVTEAGKHYIGIGNIAAGNTTIDRFRFIGSVIIAGVIAHGLPWSDTAPLTPEEDDYIVFSGTYETDV